MIENGIMRGAILMLALGEDEAAEVMKYLGPREVQKLGAAMASLKAVGHEDVQAAGSIAVPPVTRRQKLEENRGSMKAENASHSG